MIRLNLLDVGVVEETGSILLVLRSPELARLLVVETGFLEGQAVALEAQGERSDRPMTQDLMYEMLQSLGARLEEVQIHDFREETFFAKVVLVRAVDGGHRVELDARPSDAIALALRAGAPIYVADEVLAETGLPEERTGRFAELYAEEEAPPGGRTVH